MQCDLTGEFMGEFRPVETYSFLKSSGFVRRGVISFLLEICWMWSSSPKIDWALGETESSLTEAELDFKGSSFVRSSRMLPSSFWLSVFFFSCITLYVNIWFEANYNQPGCVCNVCWSAELCSWITSLLFCTSAISFTSALLTAWKTKLLFKCWINYT